MIFNEKDNILIIRDISTTFSFFWLVKNEFRESSLGFGNIYNLWATHFSLKCRWHISIYHSVNCRKILPHLNSLFNFIFFIFFSDFFFKFYWGVVDLQCCDFFLLYNEVIRLYVYTHPFYFRFFSYTDYHRELSRVLCAIEQVLIGQ